MSILTKCPDCLSTDGTHEIGCASASLPLASARPLPNFDALTGLVVAAGERARALGYLGPEVPLSELTECAHEEVSELFRAYRRGELDAPCDKPIPLTCGEEECADMLERVLELAAFLKVDLARAHRIKSEFSLTQPHRGAGGRRA